MTRPGPSRRNPIREQIEELRASRGDNAFALARELRAQAAADQFANRDDPGVPMVIKNRLGQVQIHKAELKEVQGSTCIDIWTGSRTEAPPDYRIFNPPTLAQDPEGDIEVGGKMYREDPMAAIAEVILSPIGNPGPAVSDQ